MQSSACTQKWSIISMLIYHKDPKGLTGREISQLDTSISLLQNIKNNHPTGFNHQVTDIYINGQKINPLSYDLSRQATIFDEITIVNRQQGAELIISIVIAVVAAVASYLLMPKASVPNSSGEQKDSTNNRLTGQTNIARLYQAKPDIYGSIRAYPDIVNPATSEYVDNIKYLEHLFCIGVGQYDIQQVKYDSTLLDKISGTSYKIYNPGDIIPEVRYQFKSAEVDGQELTPPNLSDEVLHEDEFSNIVNYSESNGIATITLEADANTEYLDELNLPVYLNYIVNADLETTVRISSANSIKNQINTDIRYRGILNSITIDDDGLKQLNVSNVSFVSYANSFKGDVTSTKINNSKLVVEHSGGVYTDAFMLTKKGSEIWTDLSFARGLQGYVELRFIWWEVDDFGNEIANTRENYDWSLRNNTYEPQNVTVKIKPKSGLAKYAMIIGRLNNGNSDLSDQVKVENVSTISYDYDYKVKDTLIYVKTKATSQATSLKELKFNAIATRKVISYNRDTGDIDYTLKPSRSFADAVLHTFVMIYNRDPDELDIDSLYAIDEKIKLSNEKLGYFDFSFDDIDVSLGQRIETICNAARVYVYRDVQKWRFARNEAKTRPVAMFNSLNLVNSSEGGTVQKKSSLPSSYDGVQVEYVDSSYDRVGGTDKKAYINLRIKDKQIIEEQAFRPLKLELAGCRNYTQAMNRAQLEVRRLIYERTFVEDEAFNDANLVDKGDLVLWSDTYDETVVGGEIVKINGKQFYVDQELELDKNKSYRVAITNKGGYPSDWLGVISHDNNSFTADFSDAYIANNIESQMGSIFIITEIVSEEPTEFLLTKKQYNDGTYKISLTNYDKRIYEYDNAA